MAARAQISFSASAIQDLEDLQNYYVREGAPDAGKRFVSEIITRIEQLASHPLIGREVPEFDVEHLREIIHPPFRIVYRTEKNKIRIVRIWRSERLLKIP